MKDISEGIAAMNANRTISDEQKAYFINNRVPGTAFQFPAKQYKDKRRRSGFMSRHCCSEWFDKFDILLPWMDYFVCRVFCSLCQHIKGNGLTFLLRPLIRTGRMRRQTLLTTQHCNTTWIPRTRWMRFSKQWTSLAVA